MKVSVVIPALNEGGSVALTITEIKSALDCSFVEKYEIVVVNDGSQDSTEHSARAAGANVINHLQNTGYGRSLKDGIEASSYDSIVICDADGTYPANHIPQLLERYREGYDMVVGERTGDHYRESVMKSPLRAVLRSLVEFTTARNVADVNSGLRVFSRGQAMKYFPRLCDTFSFTTSITLAYMMNNKFVLYVPIGYKERIGKTKVRLLKDSIRTLQYIVQAILYYDPMKVFLVISGAALVFSVFSFLVTLVFSLRSTFLLGVGAILVAMIVFCMGLLADLLKQIMHK